MVPPPAAYDEEEESGEEGSGSEDHVKKLDELLKRATPSLERLNQLYQQFAAGILAKPPLEDRARVDQLMAQLNLMPKPTPAYRFRHNNLQNTFNIYRKLWEKIMHDLETGKLKRPAGPKR